MIEPSLFALLGPGTGIVRKPDMTLTADAVLVFELFMQTGPRADQETAIAAFAAEMGLAAPSPGLAVVQIEKVDKLPVSGVNQPDSSSRLAVELPLGSAFSEQGKIRLPSVDLPPVPVAGSVAAQPATTEQSLSQLAPVERPDIVMPATISPLPAALQPNPTTVEPADTRSASPDLSASMSISGQPKQQVAVVQPNSAAQIVVNRAANADEAVSGIPTPSPDEKAALSQADRPASAVAATVAPAAALPPVSPMPAARPMARTERAEGAASAEPLTVPANDSRPNPPAAATGPAPSPVVHGDVAPQPTEGRAAPALKSATDHLPTTQLASAAPVVTSWFRQRADLPNVAPMGAEAAGIVPQSDHGRGVAARAETAPAIVADRPKPQETTLASIAPQTTMTSAPADAPAALMDPAIDLVSAEVHKTTPSAADPIRIAPSFAEHAPRVIETIAHAARALADRPVELVLNPEELGRLRMTLLSTDGGMVVQLTVERPETLELLRRHIDLLASDLRQAGYDRLSFGFAADQQAGGQPTPQHANRPETATPQEVATGTNPTQQPDTLSLTLSGGGLDLRL